MPVVTSQICTESNGVNSIFASKRNRGEIFGTSLLLQVVLISSMKPISSSISLSLMLIWEYRVFEIKWIEKCQVHLLHATVGLKGAFQ